MATSYNGWQASRDPEAIDIDRGFTAAGRKFPGGVKRGPVSVVLRYVIEEFNKRVEPVDLYAAGDEWGWHYKPSANSPSLLSCHSSGTAVDINATRHPNGTHPSKTFTPTQIDVIRDILREVDGVVRWLGDARTPDPMHFEIKGSATEVARVAGRLLSKTPTPQPKPSPRRPVHSRGGAMFHPTTPLRADDFWVDDNGHVGHEWTVDDGFTWQVEVLTDGQVASDFAWSWNPDGSKLRLFCIGTDGKRYERLSVNGAWTAWAQVRGQ